MIFVVIVFGKKKIIIIYFIHSISFFMRIQWWSQDFSLGGARLKNNKKESKLLININNKIINKNNCHTKSIKI